MNAKEAAGIPHMKGPKNGRYRYQRRVPEYAQEFVGKKVWDLSLGSNYGDAVDRAREHNRIFDDLLERLSTEEGREKHRADMDDEVAAMMVMMRPNMKLRIDHKGEVVKVPTMDQSPALWRETSDRLKAARAMPRDEELKTLAAFSAYAFGDRSTFDIVGGSEYHGALVDTLRPQRPTDPVDAGMFDAMKTLLDARIRELAGGQMVNPRHTLTHLHSTIASLRSSAPNTVRNHKVTTTKFLKFLREEKGIDHEPSIASITPELLQEYLDYLLADPKMGNGSIHKYFDGIKSAFNHAIKTRKVPGVVVNPVTFLEMPRASAVEDTMYLPFDDDEIVRVWNEAQAEWDPDNHKSKLSQDRRRAFLIVFRVLLWSGLRPVEAFWLRDHGGVRDDYIDIQKTKTGIKRKLPISDNISDFPAFVAGGGFDACIFDGLYRGEYYSEYNAEKLAEAMRRSFAGIRERAKITEPRKVLYSTKDTLLRRLRYADGYTTPIEVNVTGHVKKLEKGRHYGGTLGEDPKMRAQVKKVLDSITYW